MHLLSEYIHVIKSRGVEERQAHKTIHNHEFHMHNPMPQLVMLDFRVRNETDAHTTTEERLNILTGHIQRSPEMVQVPACGGGPLTHVERENERFRKAATLPLRACKVYCLKQRSSVRLEQYNHLFCQKLVRCLWRRNAVFCGFCGKNRRLNDLARFRFRCQLGARFDRWLQAL